MSASDPVLDLSIIIPTFRREEQLQEAIRSVLGIQNLSFEVFVIDDSPEGGARAIVEAINDSRVIYRKRVVPTGGWPAIIRNETAKVARGRVFYFLDDDDRAIATNLIKAFTTLTTSSAGVLVSTPRPFGVNPERVQDEIRYFSKATAFLNCTHSKFALVARLLFAPSPLVCSTCAIKASTFAAVGGFDETIPLCEDAEFYQRAIRARGFVFQPEPILERRVGEVTLISMGSSDKFEFSYRKAHNKYHGRHGYAEFWALKFLSKILDWIAPKKV